MRVCYKGLVLGLFLIIGFSGVSMEVKAADAPPPCLDCHRTPEFDFGVFQKSVHGSQSCLDCHGGYDTPTHHSNPPMPIPKDQEARVLKYQKKSKAPLALLACTNCHSDVTAALATSVHEKWIREDRPAAGPTCVDCHGSIHAVVKAESKNLGSRQKASSCGNCHGSAEQIVKTSIGQDVVPTYQDSIHGKLVAVGSDRAPVCHTCHGNHGILQVTDANSPVNPENKPKTCAKCHEGANAAFASVVSHRPMAHHGSHPGPHWTHIFFSYLTTLTLLGLSAHILIDLFGEIRTQVRRRRGAKHAGVPAGLPEAVERLDLHQRIQHWLLISSVILLVITGWPIRAAAIQTSRTMIAFLGGAHMAGILHRIGAGVLIVAGVYHIIYLLMLARKKRLKLLMVPAPKDIVDLMDNLMYFVGIRKERPNFGRFSYIEKFDYWAVFWGVAIMVGTGFVYWFPVNFATWLPSWIVNAAQLAHGEEATLAALALFVWHFYNVHLRPSIFPMNWAWLNGKISTEALIEEHPLEYKEMFPNQDTNKNNDKKKH